MDITLAQILESHNDLINMVAAERREKVGLVEERDAAQARLAPLEAQLTEVASERDQLRARVLEIERMAADPPPLPEEVP